MDKLFKKTFKLGNCVKKLYHKAIVSQKDKKLWDRFTDEDSITGVDNLLRQAYRPSDPLPPHYGGGFLNYISLPHVKRNVLRVFL